MNAHASIDSPCHFEQLGKIAWLWMNSPLHVDWTLGLASRFLLPAIEARQIHLLEREGLPVAYCSWAWLSPEAELAYLIDPANVLAQDWRSGDRLWFIDWVAPFAAGDSWHLRRAMMARFPDEVARAIRVKRDKTRARVMEFKGPALASDVARERLDRYFDNVLTIARRKSCAADLPASAGCSDPTTTEANHE